MKTPTPPIFDIIVIGQSFVDFYGEQIGASLKDMLSFKKHVGGITAYAKGFARLGLNTALISSIAQDDLGQFIIETMQHEKVDISQVQMDSQNQSAIMFRATQNRLSFPLIHYKNQGAPILADEAFLSAAFIAKAQALLITSSSFETTNGQRIINAAIDAAQQRDTKIILALDYIDDNNQSTLLKILPHCSLIVGYEQDFKYLIGEKEAYNALTQLRTLTNALFMLKNNQGCFCFSQIPLDVESTPHHKGFGLDKNTPFTAKESFIISGVYAWLNGFSQEKCCEYAMAGLSLTQEREDHSDSLPSLDELTIYLSSQSQVVQTIRTPLFEHIHYATRRVSHQDELYTFNFGTHQQWLKMAEAANVDEEVITQAKMLIATGIQKAAMDYPNVSILTDAFPENELLDALSAPHLLMRGLEVPGQVPLQFQGDTDVTHTLLHWPKHHAVKLTFVYHPDDRYALRQQQEAVLSHLYLATRRTGHELILDLAPSASSLITASTISHIMQRMYEIGIYPDWWQIVPPRDQRSFENMQRVITENDRFCKGVMLLGLQATNEQLQMMFNNAAKQDFCKGFVVDKSLFQVELNQWCAQMISNQALIDAVSRNFEKAIASWQQAKAKAQSAKTA